MSEKQRLYHQKRAAKKLGRLGEMLAAADDGDWLFLAWAVNVLQTEFSAAARKHIRFPAAAATAAVQSPYAVRKWELETLLALTLSTAKLNHRQPLVMEYATMAAAINLLRDVDNHEGGANLGPADVMLEMARIGHRQFGWQRGFATTERVYRYFYIYGQGKCAEYFEHTYGLPIADFMRTGFYLFAQLHHQPWAKPVTVDGIGVDLELVERALPLLSLNLMGSRNENQKLIAQLQAGAIAAGTSYLPSVFRRYPIVRDDALGAYIAPLPQLIVHRMTVGLYYDVAGGPQALLAEANGRFESYVGKLIAAYYPRFELHPSQSYGKKKARLASPDVLVGDDGQVRVVIECKATKLTYEAQFAQDPIATAKSAFDQLVKGVAQVWRFFSHVRRGIYVGPPVAGDAQGVLLTLDTWMQADAISRDKVIAQALELVAGEAEVIDVDKRPIVFCSMQDLADVMIVSSEEQFFEALSSATEARYHGWDLMEVRRRAGNQKPRDFPLEIADLLPWWALFQGAQDEAKSG
ncbi:MULTISPECIES: hypothetical protein [unclassified Devosia]|uniref:hypothetical protein n=1 Tax=unclassified Devosia TaxID=196773 RepID=UPI000714B11C|nr:MULTISPECIES: hypothetical protein [unclassified Devosia]KQU96291.1 hypothetical protein ASC68_12955 [Devosia sp. Root105]